jgi:nucleoside-diphosphate-sugar epimerase
MLFASSCSVYGFTDNMAFSEDDAAVCNYPYGVSKLQGEAALMALATPAFSVVCFRQGTVSGYSPRMRLDLALNTMFKNALHKGTITLSNHSIWRPVLAMKDLCVAYEAAINALLSPAEIFNISSFNATVGELAAITSIFMKKNYGLNIRIVEQHIQDYRNYKVSTHKAARLLNFRATQSAEHILAELSANRQRFSDFEDDRYYNINVFRKLNLDEQSLIAV